MPTAPRETVLCRYRYDPLDRLTDCAPAADARIQRFYCKSRLATEIQGAVQRTVLQHDDQLLAQLRREHARVDTTLLATDQQRSVLNPLDATRPHPLAYTPYGHRPAENGLLSLLGFNGERPDPVTGHYLLGNGYRAFNPVLMRFNSPDNRSPFREGGINAYAYCMGDPINRTDPTGHSLIPAQLFDDILIPVYKRIFSPTLGKTHFTNAIENTKALFGGAEKLEKVAANQKIHSDVIIARTLADKKDFLSLERIILDEKLSEPRAILTRAKSHLDELLEYRNRGYELYNSNEYYPLLDNVEKRNLELNVMDYNAAIEHDTRYLLSLRQKAPHLDITYIKDWLEWFAKIRRT